MMKIMLAGSFSFAQDMLDIKNRLLELGHQVFHAKDLNFYATNSNVKYNFEEELRNCIEMDSIRDGFNKILDSEAILVCNYDKHNIKGYLGTSVLMEIGLAYFHRRQIYLLNKFDKSQNYGLEISVVEPIIINGDLSVI